MDLEIGRADIVIRPDLSGVPVSDLAARGRAIEAGEAAARAALPRILRLIEAHKPK
jgi:predicted acylesterase/phospholipase RssA